MFLYLLIMSCHKSEMGPLEQNFSSYLFPAHKKQLKEVEIMY